MFNLATIRDAYQRLKKEDPDEPPKTMLDDIVKTHLLKKSGVGKVIGLWRTFCHVNTIIVAGKFLKIILTVNLNFIFREHSQMTSAVLGVGGGLNLSDACTLACTLDGQISADKGWEGSKIRGFFC